MTDQAATDARGSVPLFDDSLIARGEVDDDLLLIGWRCTRCARLSFGARRMCPFCGARSGRMTRLQEHGWLETWTTVSAKEHRYTVGYCMVGDGEDDQEVRVFGPLVADDEAHLRSRQRIRIGFDQSVIAGRTSVHHVFRSDADAGAFR